MARTRGVKSGCTLGETEQIGCRASCPRSLLSFCVYMWVQERAGFLSNCSNSFLAVPGGLVFVSSPYSFSFSHFPQASAHPPLGCHFDSCCTCPPVLPVLWPLLCMHLVKGIPSWISPHCESLRLPQVTRELLS